MPRLLPLSLFLATLATSGLVQAADPSSSAPASLEVDQLEWQHADEGSVFNWDLEGWALGGGANRLDFRSQGERSNGHTEQAEVQALWGHSLAKGWGSVAGIRQDFKPGSPQTWAPWASRSTIPRISTSRSPPSSARTARPPCAWKPNTTGP